MKSATVRDLRNNFAVIEAWLAEGEQVQIKKRGQPMAMLTASSPGSGAANAQRPDFAARRRAIWGDRVFSDQEVAEMKTYELEGQEG
jgi:antitoxin (DNA-binding transcriptional repressor) of toxin-antitoxin stability system